MQFLKILVENVRFLFWRSIAEASVAAGQIKNLILAQSNVTTT